eukprot:TRINITY_DN105449_c0_g1_i1.p1 TRINITY_DN105449_c0_g1~~TRINITY_DN105449_c0_g1_i1.p1  ORF type:complete len:102 (+),score=33.02 TRINITY_DN105449_c0_g1_i1:120-425(+)
MAEQRDAFDQAAAKAYQAYTNFMESVNTRSPEGHEASILGLKGQPLLIVIFFVCVFCLMLTPFLAHRLVGKPFMEKHAAEKKAWIEKKESLKKAAEDKKTS